MTIQVGDASSNPVFTDVTATGSPGALTATVTATLRGQSTATVQVTGIGTMTLTFEGTTDGTNFDPILATPIAGGAPVSTTTTNGHWVNINVAGLASFRVRVSAFTSGTATTTIIASQGSALPNYTTGGLNKVDIASWNGTALGVPTNFGTTPTAVVAGSVNSSLFIGTTVATAAAAGIQKVGISGNAGASLDAATAAAVPANAIYAGLRAATANPTNATGGNMVGAMADKAGRQVVVVGNVRELIGVQTTTIAASTAETTIVTAGGAGVFNDLSHLSISTTNVVAATVTIKDATAGTTRLVFNIPPTAATTPALVCDFPIPIPQAAANANWTATVSVNAGNVIINAVFVKNL